MVLTFIDNFSLFHSVCKANKEVFFSYITMVGEIVRMPLTCFQILRINMILMSGRPHVFSILNGESQWE